jgi:hypothetical protein
MALKTIFTIVNAPEQRNFGTLAYRKKRRYKWNNQAKERRTAIGGKRET